MKKGLIWLLTLALCLSALSVPVVDTVADAARPMSGDINSDGKVNIRDLGSLQQHLNHWEVDVQLAAADVTGDGKVNVRDLGLLQQYLNGWDVTLAPIKPQNPIRVLSIGHSFSVDAMRAYLWPLLSEAGYDYIVLGYLFYPSCSLNEQWDRMQGNADHQLYCKTDPYTGEWSNHYPPDNRNQVQFAIQDEAWDVITIQPDPDYGGGPEYWPGVTNDYKNVGNIVNWIHQHKTNPDGKLYYHLTWSFATDCALWCFGQASPFKGDQLLHYRSFVDAAQKYVLTPYGDWVAGVIPAGTAIQNARSSYVGDTFNLPGNNDPRNGDGYHLNDKGDYLAALTWYTTLTGRSAATAWCPEEYADIFPVLVEAVDNAATNPLDVTESAFQ